MLFSKYRIGDKFVIERKGQSSLRGVLIKANLVKGSCRVKWTSFTDQRSHSWVHSYPIEDFNDPDKHPHIKLIQNGIDKLDDIL